MDIERLERLAQLRRSGALTDEEFEREKAQLLAAEKPVQQEKPKRNFGIWAFVLVASIAAAVLALELVSTATSDAPSRNAEVAGGTPPAEATEASAPPSGVPIAEATGALSLTDEEQRLLDEWRDANEMCRGSPDERSIETWCPRRDEAAEALNRAGFCYGHADDQSAADYEIHRCGNGSVGF